MLIPPMVYVDAVRKVLAAIDLDPCSTEAAQTIIDATAWYPAANARAAMLEAWFGRVFLQPHPNSKLARLQVQKLLRDYLCDRVPAAILHLRNLELLRVEPLLLSFPICLHYRRMPMQRWNTDLQVMQRFAPPFPSLTIYLPQRHQVEIDADCLERFAANFHPFGRPILAETLHPDWESDAVPATSNFRPRPILPRAPLDLLDAPPTSAFNHALRDHSRFSLP